MPNRKTHLAVGIPVGIAAAVISSKAVASEHRSIEIIAAVAGAALGSLAPDLLEPAISPNHRSLFHSVAAGAGIGAAVAANWQADCRRNAAACDARALALPSESPSRSDEEWKAVLWRGAAGFLVAFMAAYASHLALDAVTRRSLPLVAQGF